MKDTATATGIGTLAIAILLGFSINSFYTRPGLALALTAVSFLSSLALLLMAMRKFGNNEIDAGSKIVAKANLFGFAAFFLLVVSMAESLGGLFGAIVLLAGLAAFAWLYSFGKNSLKYW